MLRVGFDASPLTLPHPLGIRRVVAETLAALEARGAIEVVRLAPDRGRGTRAWRQRVLPREVRGRDLAGIHSFVSAFPVLGPGRRVQTIHELPWRHGVRENADLRHRLWARLGPRRADAVVTATETTAREIGVRRAGEGGRLHVVPWGVSPFFAPEPAPGTVDEPLLDRYRLTEEPFVLAAGAVRAKKDLAALLQGVARLASDGRPVPKVVVTGEHTADLRRDLGLAQRLGLARFVSTPGEVPEEDLPGLLRLASAACLLSRSEGFGLPVLEAMACGTPVVVPRQSAQAEVAGPEAFAVDAHDPASVAGGVAAAIERREALRFVLPGRAREFPWSRTAEGIEELWKGFA